ncbi:hypothetical protein ACOMHN_039530 [Nucella lapillus]
MVFAARQIQEKCKEQSMDLCILFVDLTKAFDTVSRPGLWNILPHIGIPPKMVKIVRFFHDGMNARLVNSSENDEFLDTNGVKQGCVLAPTLFSFLFSMMLLSAFNDSRPGIQITYRTDGAILNTQRLKAETKLTKSLVRGLLYADDCTIVAHSEDDLQRLTDFLSAATKRFGLTISIKKTEVIFQPSKGSTANMPEIKIDGKVINNVDSFTYLGSSLSFSNCLDREISNRMHFLCIYALLTQSQLRWSGHLVRMEDSRLPKQLFYGELTEGLRPRGQPKLLYRDTLKKFLQKCDIDDKQWDFLATDRSEWKQAICKGTEAYENEI